MEEGLSRQVVGGRNNGDVHEPIGQPNEQNEDKAAIKRNEGSELQLWRIRAPRKDQ